MRLTEAHLKSFQEAIYKDYGIVIPEDKVFEAAFELLEFFEALLKFDQEDKNKAKEEENEKEEKEEVL